MPLTLGGQISQPDFGQQRKPPTLAGGGQSLWGSEALGESHDQSHQLLLGRGSLVGWGRHQCQLAGGKLAGGTLCGDTHLSLCGGLTIAGRALRQASPRLVLVGCSGEEPPQNFRRLLGGDETVPDRLPCLCGADCGEREEKSPNDEDSLPARRKRAGGVRLGNDVPDFLADFGFLERSDGRSGRTQIVPRLLRACLGVGRRGICQKRHPDCI